MDTAIAPPTASQLSTDPVSSLRAAALSTLKAKRRKPQSDRSANLPVRPPPPTDTVHLDYGADDAPQDVLMKDLPVWPATPPSPVGKSQILPNHLTREEGEISEEDEPPLANSSVKTPLATVSSTPKATPEPRHEADRPRQTPPLRTPPVAKSVALPDSPQASSSAIPALPDTPMEGIILTDPPLVLSPLTMDSARPGLQLTQHQYDTLKFVILDLLGWGVPPDYLLVLGVSREAVFYVFSELNLALPEGFDTSGLIPYMPDLLPQPQRSTVMPPPSIPDNRGDSKGKRSHPANHPGHPPTKSSGPDTSLPLDLHDIERQRRQELMARKAAQASRKMKQSTSLGSSNGSSTAKEILTMTPASATEAVDDFLNSIGPVVDLGVGNRKKSVSSDDMDAQDTPTALDRVRRLSSSSESQSTPSQDTTSTVDALVSITDGFILAENREVALIDNHPPPPSSSSSGFSQISDSDVIPTTSHMERSNFRSRRGTKRAVATDFDFDAFPRKTGSAYPPAKQSKTAFVTIASRRCVIDLSDSETDDDPSHYAHTPGMDPLVTKNDWKGKPGANSPPNLGKPSTPGVPPSALLQKEIEIQKMRELIARREEETRMKKLAAKPIIIPNGDIAGPNILQPQPILLKVEETDVVMSVDFLETELIARRSSESASPPGEISEASLPVTRSVTKSPIVKCSMQYVGDQDLASTARETQVQPELSTDPPPFMFSAVDVDMFPSSSAQMNKRTTITSPLPKLDGRKPTLSEALDETQNHDDPQPIPEYNEYHSPFDLYPLLRSQSSISDLSSSLFIHSSSVVTYNRHSSPARLAPSWPSIGPSFVPDLKSLRQAVLSKRLDPSKRLCQYESGGGTCRDDKCDDLHLSRLEGMTASGLLDPTDKETADFLFSVLPHSWLSTYQVHSPDRILEALQEVQQPTNDLADKVATAMALIGSFPPPTSS